MTTIVISPKENLVIAGRVPAIYHAASIRIIFHIVFLLQFGFNPAVKSTGIIRGQDDFEHQPEGIKPQ